MKHFTAALALAALVPTLAATPAVAHEPKRTQMPEDAGAAAFLQQFGFSEAVIHGDMVYLSGIVAGPAPAGTSDEQMYDATFATIGRILERAGSSWDDVVDLTTFHVDIDQSLPPLAAAKSRYVKAPFPAWTAIDIDRLYTPDGLVEIKVVARLTPKAD